MQRDSNLRACNPKLRARFVCMERDEGVRCLPSPNLLKTLNALGVMVLARVLFFYTPFSLLRAGMTEL